MRYHDGGSWEQSGGIRRNHTPDTLRMDLAAGVATGIVGLNHRGCQTDFRTWYGRRECEYHARPCQGKRDTDRQHPMPPVTSHGHHLLSIWV